MLFILLRVSWLNICYQWFFSTPTNHFTVLSPQKHFIIIFIVVPLLVPLFILILCNATVLLHLCQCTKRASNKVGKVSDHHFIKGGVPSIFFWELQFWDRSCPTRPIHVPTFWWSFGTSAPNRLRATPRPNMGAWNSHMAILILGGHMGHQIVPLITLSHPI